MGLMWLVGQTFPTPLPGAASDNPECIVTEAANDWVPDSSFPQACQSLASCVGFQLCSLGRGLQSSLCCPFISASPVTSTVENLFFFSFNFLVFENGNDIQNRQVCVWFLSLKASLPSKEFTRDSERHWKRSLRQRVLIR